MTNQWLFTNEFNGENMWYYWCDSYTVCIAILKWMAPLPLASKAEFITHCLEISRRNRCEIISISKQCVINSAFDGNTNGQQSHSLSFQNSYTNIQSLNRPIGLSTLLPNYLNRIEFLVVVEHIFAKYLSNFLTFCPQLSWPQTDGMINRQFR